MSQAFNPKFVDLVRVTSTTQGTGPLVCGPAAPGCSSFAEMLGAGDSFYYSIQGVDKPQEREVGRGTYLANGTISRQPLRGSLTNFTAGNKTISLVASSEWYDRMQQIGAASDRQGCVDDVPSLAAITAVPGATRMLVQAGREGSFVFRAGDFSAKVTADPARALFVAPASAPTGASGAWVRQYTGPALTSWWGLSPSNTPAANGAALDAALATAKALSFSAGGYGFGSFPLHTPTGIYALDRPTVISHDLRFTGEAAGKHTGGGTVFDYTGSTGGIEITQAVGRCVLDGFFLKGTGAALLGSGKHGLKVRGKVSAQNLSITGFERGIDCFGNTGQVPPTNCNGATFRNISIWGCVWGSWSQGPDANNILFDTVSANDCKLGGHMDASFLGNIYVGGDLSVNGQWETTYRNKCHLNGHIYSVLPGQEAWCSANGPTGAATSNQGWCYFRNDGAAAYQPTWTAGQTWYFSAPYAMAHDNNNARSVFRDIYVEPGQNPAVMNWPGMTYVGCDVEKVINPAGANYSGQLRVGFNGLVQMGNIEFRELSTTGFTKHLGSGSIPLLEVDPNANQVRVGSGSASSVADFTLNNSGSGWSQLRLATNGAQRALFYCSPFGTAALWSITDLSFERDGAGEVAKIQADGFNLSAGKALLVGGTQVVGARRTGWTAATGTPSRGAFAAAAPGTASATYVQSEAQSRNDRIAALESRLIALETDLRGHGLIN